MPSSDHSGVAGGQRQEEAPLVVAQALLDFTHHTFSRGEQRIERHRLGRHALKVVLVVVSDVPQRREQHFMDRPVAAGQIDHKRAPGCRA